MPIRIALAGTGFIAAVHARAALNQPGVELAGVVTTRADKAVDFTTRFNIPGALPTLAKLLDACPVDALVVCTPNLFHAPLTIEALQAGVHVLVEKPMAMSVAEGDAMLEASRSSGATLMVAHCWRFDTEVNWLKEQILAGRLGQAIRTKGYGVHTNWGPAGWFTQKALAGGGALADMGIHALDTARYLLGDPQPVSVYARLGTHYNHADVDDTGVLLVTWENGAVSYIESGWWQPYSDGPEAATQVYGTRGFGSIFPTHLVLPNPAEKTVERLEPGFPHPRLEHAPQELYDRQMAYFLECIRNQSTPIPGGLEGLVNMKIIEAAYLSSQNGKIVTF